MDKTIISYKDIIWRKKKAIQYGTNTDKSLLKLAKLKGFKYKKELIDSLC